MTNKTNALASSAKAPPGIENSTRTQSTRRRMHQRCLIKECSYYANVWAANMILNYQTDASATYVPAAD